MSTNQKKYGTDDECFITEYHIAETIFEKFKDCKVETINDVYEIVSSLMVQYGSDRHTDGSEIIALVLYKLLKN